MITPVRFATFHGYIPTAELGTRKGPNLLGEILRVVDLNHRMHPDGTITTRVGYAYGAGEPQVKVRPTAFGMLVKIDDQDWRRL